MLITDGALFSTGWKAEYEVVHLFFLCGICLPSVELQRRFVTSIIAVVMASLGLKAITTAGPSRTKHSQIIFLKVNDRIYIYGQHTQNNGKQSNTIQAAVLTVVVKVLWYHLMNFWTLIWWVNTVWEETTASRLCTFIHLTFNLQTSFSSSGNEPGSTQQITNGVFRKVLPASVCNVSCLSLMM